MIKEFQYRDIGGGRTRHHYRHHHSVTMATTTLMRLGKCVHSVFINDDHKINGEIYDASGLLKFIINFLPIVVENEMLHASDFISIEECTGKEKNRCFCFCLCFCCRAVFCGWNRDSWYFFLVLVGWKGDSCYFFLALVGWKGDSCYFCVIFGSCWW